MKTYVLTVSEFFPKTHNKTGLPTGFINSIGNKSKKHTIRGNYELWKKRFEKIDKGEACLSIRYWTGKPYNSPQKEVFNLTKTDGIGVQKLKSWDLLHDRAYCLNANKNVLPVGTDELAKNDGLTPSDFKEWFKKYDLSKPMAIIHFTSFRYWC
jgi:hypothetical protein